ncbi:MAG: GTPase Era [Arenimonas sp.]|nr:GTPase Era [Arenimonas sp.]MBP7917221.1 GTPase Era [Arenimonas sp.]
MTSDQQQAPYRAGYTAVIGRPNVGKSTLVNALVGSKISIVSSRPQTTRHRMLGIASFPEGQLVLVDTPGIHAKQSRAMNRYMNRAARGAVSDVHAAVLVIEAGRWHSDDALAYQALRESDVPVLLVINKIDKLKDKDALLPFIKEITAEREFTSVHLISALKKKGTQDLVDSLLKLMPVSEPIFDEDEITDKSQRFLAGELVREQLMQRLGDELPYSSTVEIEKFEVDGSLLRIGAVIWLEREGQKAIVIGKGGQQLKAISTSARIGMEKLFGSKVFLETWCRVRDGWSDDEAALRRFGYNE